LTDHEQAQIDLKRFVQKCKRRNIELDAKIAILEHDRKNKTKLNRNVAASRSTSKVMDQRNVPKVQKKGEDKSVHESTAKPRSLLASFLRADQDVHNDHTSIRAHTTFAVVKTDENSSELATLPYRQPKSSHQPESRFIDDFTADITHPSEKKVRWRQDYTEGDSAEEVQLTQTVFTAMKETKGTVKRKTFGSNRSDDGKRESQPPSSKDTLRSNQAKLIYRSSILSSKDDIEAGQLSSNKKGRIGNGRSSKQSSLEKELKTNDSKSNRSASENYVDVKNSDKTSDIRDRGPKSLSKRNILTTSTTKGIDRANSMVLSRSMNPDETTGPSNIEEEKVPGARRRHSLSSTTKLAPLKSSSFSSRSEPNTEKKKRMPSCQSSGISSQEGPSKIRRRKRIRSSGASVSSKPDLSNFDEVEFSFNF
jgi:hypothetical protein